MADDVPQISLADLTQKELTLVYEVLCDVDYLMVMLHDRGILSEADEYQLDDINTACLEELCRRADAPLESELEELIGGLFEKVRRPDGQIGIGLNAEALEALGDD